MKYNTRNKKELISLFASNSERAYSAEDILALLPDMSQSTLYRLISSLYEEGLLRKVESEGRSCCYQYRNEESCGTHMHIRCKSCGQIEHLDEDTSDKIKSLISTGIGFEALSSTMLDGICSTCKEEK